MSKIKLNWFSKKEVGINYKFWRVVYIFSKLKIIVGMNKNIEDLKSIINLYYFYFCIILVVRREC